MKWEYKTVVIETEKHGLLKRSGAIEPSVFDKKLEVIGTDAWEMVSAVPVMDGSNETSRIVLFFKRGK